MAGRTVTKTKLRASGYRFILRRIERALLCGTVRPGCEPVRLPSALAVGCLLAIAVVTGCALLAFAQPRPDPAGASIVMGRRSGALYVRLGETLHPVLNLASARLIAATTADPLPVRESDLDRIRRGPLLGIPGAPQLLGEPLSDARWSVCDSAADSGPVTAVIVDSDRPAPAGQPVNPAQPVLVNSGAKTYLLQHGRRAVLRAEVSGPTPRQVSGWLLNAIPEAPLLGDTAAASAAPRSAAGSTLCVNWTRRTDGGAEITLSVGDGLGLPPGQRPVPLVRADGAGPALDAVYLPPGRSVYVRAAGVSESAGGERYLVTETGLRFPIGDDDAARSLGLVTAATPAPWPILAALPAGPQLSRQHALIAREADPDAP